MKKQLIAALVICVGLGTVYFFSREKEIRIGIKELALSQIDPQNITKVVYRGKEEFALRKVGDSFVVELSENGQKRDVPASKEAIKELFDALLGVKGGIFVTEQASKHEEFQVDDTKGQRVTLFAKDKPVWELIIGDYAEESGRYVRVPAQNAVFLAKARFWDITRNNMNDFREHKIVPFADDSIEAIRFEEGTGEIGLARDEKKIWALDAKTAAMVSQEQVSQARINDLLKTVTGLRATGFVETESAVHVAQTILDASGSRVTVKPKGAEDLVVVVAHSDKEKKAYAQVKGSKAIFEISEYVYGRLRPKTVDFKEVAESEKGKKSSPSTKTIETDMNSLPSDLRKQVQEAIRKQQKKS